MVAVSQYQMNLLYLRWQMLGTWFKVIEKRDEDYCVSMHTNVQFSICV